MSLLEQDQGVDESAGCLALGNNCKLALPIFWIRFENADCLGYNSHFERNISNTEVVAGRLANIGMTR